MRLVPMLFSAAGRIRRRDYWLYSVLNCTTWFILSAVVLGTMGVLGYAKPATAQSHPDTVWNYIYLPFFLWASVCITAKRLHDRGRSGWLAPLALIPVAGWIWAIVDCGVLTGQPGDNAYGPQPD